MVLICIFHPLNVVTGYSCKDTISRESGRENSNNIESKTECPWEDNDNTKQTLCLLSYAQSLFLYLIEMEGGNC